MGTVDEAVGLKGAPQSSSLTGRRITPTVQAPRSRAAPVTTPCACVAGICQHAQFLKQQGRTVMVDHVAAAVSLDTLVIQGARKPKVVPLCQSGTPSRGTRLLSYDTGPPVEPVSDFHRELLAGS